MSSLFGHNFSFWLIFLVHACFPTAVTQLLKSNCSYLALFSLNLMAFPAHFQAQSPTNLSNNIPSSFCWSVLTNTHSQCTVRVFKVLLTGSSPSSQTSLPILQSFLFLFTLYLTHLISLCVKSVLQPHL